MTQVFNPKVRYQPLSVQKSEIKGVTKKRITLKLKIMNFSKKNQERQKSNTNFVSKLTTQRRSSILNNTLTMFILLIIGLAMISGCSSDDNDGPSSTITAQAQTFTVNGINNCNTSIGPGSTLVFTIPYTSTSGLSIEKLRIKTTVSNGESEEGVNNQITDNNSEVTWVSCFHFGLQDWVEYEVRLESSDGTLSNAVKTRVNKPNGAN